MTGSCPRGAGEFKPGSPRSLGANAGAAQGVEEDRILGVPGDLGQGPKTGLVGVHPRPQLALRTVAVRAAFAHGAPMRTVVTGANRGIGLELVRQLARRGDEVEACARNPAEAQALKALAGAKVRLHRLDVADDKSVSALAQALAGAPIDIVFNVAGVYGGPGQSVRQMAEDLLLADVAHTYQVNAIGALRVAVALLPNVRQGAIKKLVHVTSGMGSIDDNTSGGYYAYRMSKAALNMMSRSLAVDLKREGIASYVINPGWVQTDMGGSSAPTRVEDSVEAILREVDRATLADSGEFLDYKGGRLTW